MTALTPNDRFISLSPGAGTTVLAYDFELMLEAGMAVTLVRAGVETVLTLGVDFSFPGGIGDATGGTLTLAVASVAADVFLLVGAQPEQRLSDFVAAQRFTAQKMNADLDALTMVAQEHRRDITRSWKSPFGTAGKLIVPGGAGELLKFDVAGNVVTSGENVDTIEGATAAAAASAASAETHADITIEQAGVATTKATEAAASAAGVNLPAITVADAGELLVVKPDGSGYVTSKIAETNVVPTATDALRITIGNVTNPARFGTWDKTGVADGSAAFTAAVASNKFVELGDGDYKISTKAVIANSQRRVIGAGKAITRLISAHASNHVIEIAAGLSDVIVEDLTTTRTVAPSAGAAGIGALGILSTSCIRRVSSFASYYGMLLRSTGYSQLQDIFLSNNKADGLFIQNTAASGPCQWYIDGLLSQANDGKGIMVSALAGPAGLLLGDWHAVHTFANSSFGIALQGFVGTPIYGMRLHESFLGTDGNTELYLDTYGYGHKCHDVFMEITGTGLTGSALTTPASGVGWGILATANNDDIRATDCTISGCSSGGFYSEATLTRVATTLFKSMGTGVNIADGNKYRENGCDFVSVTTPRTFVANPYNAHIVGSGSSLANATGINPNATRIPAGVTIGVATAGDPLAGGMNVAAGLWKNNTAYANP